METSNDSLVAISAEKPMVITEAVKETPILFKKRILRVKLPKRQPLKTKKAVEFLLAGSLKSKVCRYCLFVDYTLHGMDEIMNIAGEHAIYKLRIRDIVASFYPFKISTDRDLPNKICNKCLDAALRSYLFVQQCEQSERSLRNCLEDMFDKLNKLDPLDKMKKRGRQKLNPNYNIIHTEYVNVIDYAEPIQHLVNSGAVPYTKEPIMTELECKKCWQVLPSMEALVNHEKIHPKSMWYNCRMCGKAYSKLMHFRKHVKREHTKPDTIVNNYNNFNCKECNFSCEDLNMYLQHTEKHKFKVLLEHLLERNTNELCTICLDKGNKMVDMKTNISLYGGYPELRGYRSLYNIVGSTIPEMNIFNNYIGNKMCEICLDKAISAYVFVNKTHYIMGRLDRCITGMVEKLKDFKESDKNLFVEIAQDAVMPLDINEIDFDELFSDPIEDETKLKVDVLEDEFRIKSDSDSDMDDDKDIRANNLDSVAKTNKDINTILTAKGKTKNTKEYTRMKTKGIKSVLKENDGKLVNGYQTMKPKDVCSEFLTFNYKKNKTKKINKVKYNCPICAKTFITEYFLTKHLNRHVNAKVRCKICSESFKSKFCLQEHKKSKHLLGVKFEFTCDICHRGFGSEKKFNNHRLKHKEVDCLVCYKVLQNEKYFYNHIQKHVPKTTRKQVQTCSFCEKACSNDNQLSIHVNKVHLQIKPYSCDMCDRAFYTENNLKHHKKVHDVFKKEKCEFCDKVVKSRRCLVVHIRKHINNKPHKCILCTETFYSELKLNWHMKKLHGGCFMCKVCRNVYPNSKGLKYHISLAHSVF